MAGLAAYRRTMLLTQKELAQRAGVAVSTVEDMESGTSGRTFTPATMKKVAAALGMSNRELEIDEFRGAVQAPRVRAGSGKRKKVRARQPG